MKNKQEILTEIKDLEYRLLNTQQSYSELDQIDLLSMTGSSFKKLIAEYKGKIEALKWVINKNS